jgi:hypothetical protein
MALKITSNGLLMAYFNEQTESCRVTAGPTGFALGGIEAIKPFKKGFLKAFKSPLRGLLEGFERPSEDL